MDANTEPSKQPPTKAKAKAKAKAKSKGIGVAAAHLCANCGSEDGTQRCGGCGVVYYCTKNMITTKDGKRINGCQRVRHRARTRVCPSPSPQISSRFRVPTRPANATS